MPKLVVHDPSWPLYAPLLGRFLPARWSVATGANDVAWLAGELPDADALLALTLPAELRPVARHLKVFQFPGAGVMQTDPEDLPAGCALVNVYEHETPIAEFVLMAILMHVTRVCAAARAFRAGRWEGNGRVGGAPHEEACGKTIGLVGYGHIGQAVAQRAVALGMKVQAIRQSPGTPLPSDAVAPGSLGGPADLPRLLATSDFVVITCPLTEATRGWIGEAELRAMPPHAMLVNVSRGEIVQEEPLYRALAARRIAAAALDVWYRYPRQAGEVLHGSRWPLHELDNVLPTPHLSAWTGPMLERRMRRVAENLERWAAGLPLERVVMTGTWRPAR